MGYDQKQSSSVLRVHQSPRFMQLKQLSLIKDDFEYFNKMLEQNLDEESLLNKNLSDDYKKILEELEEKSKYLCTELEERLIIITTSLKTLKQSVQKEKQLWKNELKETVELEKKCSGHNWHLLQGGDYNNQLQLLTSAFLSSQTQIQNTINNAVYKQQLLEAENMCNLEMLKIKNSLECLAPLQAIVNEWSSDGEKSSVGSNNS